MFCKNCGNELPEGSKFCSACGTVQDAEASAATAAPAVTSENKPAAPASPNIHAIASAAGDDSRKKLAGMPKVTRFRALLLVGLIFFLFPFMTVSCADQTSKVQGFDMVFGDSDVKKQAESQGKESSGVFNIFVTASAACAVAGIVVVSIKKNEKKEKTAGCLAIAAGAFLLVFRITAKSYYKIGDQTLKELEEYGLKTEFKLPLYISMILFFAAAVVIFDVVSKKSQATAADKT